MHAARANDLSYRARGIGRGRASRGRCKSGVAQADDNSTERALIAGRYRVEGLLGRGGAGAVHRVFDEREQRSVALKSVGVDQGSLTRSRLLEMFSREYRTLAQLAHPSVISVYEYGVTEQGPYFTMELTPRRRCRTARRAPTCATSARACRCCTRVACCTATCRRAT